MHVKDTKYSFRPYWTTQGIKNIVEFYGIDYRRGKPKWHEQSTPTLVVGEFYKYITHSQRIPSQSEFWNYLQRIPEWVSWLQYWDDEPEMIVYLENRVFGNFYPSCITNIYSQALLNETGYFREVYYDVLKETSFIDLTVVTFKTGRKITLDIAVYSSGADNFRKIKERERGHKNKSDYTIRTQSHTEQFYWPTHRDFSEVIKIAQTDYYNFLRQNENLVNEKHNHQIKIVYTDKQTQIASN